MLSKKEAIRVCFNSINRIKGNYSGELLRIANTIIQLLDSWLNEKNKSIDVFELYDFIVPIVDEELNHNTSKKALSATHSLLYFVYYIVWELFPEEQFSKMPSDILEVDQTYFFNCLIKAQEASKDIKTEYSLQKEEIISVIDSKIRVQE